MARASTLTFFLGLSIALAASSLSAQTYSASGLVLNVDVAHRSLEVSCQAIPGYMEEMAMRLLVQDKEELETLQPGMIIDFKLRVHKKAAFASEIRVRGYESTAQEPMAARQLEILDAATASSARPGHALVIGAFVPDFTLLDQNRAAVSLAQFRGKVVALTFIYTRCPLPNFCFRMSNNFAALDRRFARRMGKDLVLLSVTFDPEHDTPEVLADYAHTWTKDETGWHFLTGRAAEVKNVVAEFGVTAWQDEGLMTHSLDTTVVDRQGRVAATLEGNEYTAKQLGDLIDALLNRD
jgi:protein SCO1